MLRTRGRPAVLAVLVAACGGGDRPRNEAPATVVDVPGVPAVSFEARSAIHGVGRARTTVVLSDADDLCAALGGAAGRCGGGAASGALGSRFLRIDVPGTPPGTFSGPGVAAVAVAPGEVAVAAGAGTVELGAESPGGALAGSWSLGAVGSGTFTSQRCPALDAADDGASQRSCRTSVEVENGAARFEEACSCDGEAASRTCTLAAGATQWSCECTAPSGATATCTAAAAGDGVVSPPPDCCPR